MQKETNSILRLIVNEMYVGGDHGRGIANLDAPNYDSDAGSIAEVQNMWSKLTYGVKETESPNWVDIIGRRDGLFTITNVDNRMQDPNNANAIGNDAPNALIIEGIFNDGRIGSNNVSVAATPLKEYNGAGLVYSKTIDCANPYGHYNVGIGNDDSSDYLEHLSTNLDGGIVEYDTVWEMYNQDHSDYNDYMLCSWYESDTELVLRNSEIMIR